MNGDYDYTKYFEDSQKEERNLATKISRNLDIKILALFFLGIVIIVAVLEIETTLKLWIIAGVGVLFILIAIWTSANIEPEDYFIKDFEARRKLYARLKFYQENPVVNPEGKLCTLPEGEVEITPQTKVERDPYTYREEERHYQVIIRGLDGLEYEYVAVLNYVGDLYDLIQKRFDGSKDKVLIKVPKWAEDLKDYKG